MKDYPDKMTSEQARRIKKPLAPGCRKQRFFVVLGKNVAPRYWE
jgi:hypothetical protein